MFHRTQRLFLRPAWPEDWQAMLGGIADEGVVRNLARVPWPYGPADARAFVAKPQDTQRPHFLIFEPASGQMVGCIGLGGHADGTELGYWLARPYWGRGYATEAGDAVIGLARLLGHRSLVAGHFADNPASGRVLRKLGFLPTGQTGPRYSCGRGCDVASIEYALDLEADAAPHMQAA